MIARFDGEYRFLSNFWPCSIVHEGLSYPSVEHAYQASKTLDIGERARISELTAGQAKRAGRRVVMRRDWDAVKLDVMYALLLQKFCAPILQSALQDTYPHELIEGNVWGDTFWGVCDGVGENHLGKLLMKVRDEEDPG